MEYDLSKWLKDELGLVQLSENDLNSLMFHPRHGSLCRRLIKFLAQSTLCHQRYPNVYASEEYIEATNELEKANENLLEVLKNLNLYAKENENQERELVFLQAKSEHLRILEELQQVSIAALKEMENRNNLDIEQVAQHLEKVDYRSNSSLESLYSVPDFNKVISTIMTRQTSTIDEELRDIIAKVETIHCKINGDLIAISRKMDSIAELEPKLRKTSIESLVALKRPEFEEVTIDVNEEEKKLNDRNIELMEKVEMADQQVALMKDEYETKKDDLNREYKEELDKYLVVLKELRNIECMLS